VQVSPALVVVVAGGMQEVLYSLGCIVRPCLKKKTEQTLYENDIISMKKTKEDK
jgi:hypothetical protein